MINGFLKSVFNCIIACSNRNVFFRQILLFLSLISGFLIGFAIPVCAFVTCFWGSLIYYRNPLVVCFFMFFVAPLVIYSLLKAGLWMCDGSIDKDIEDIKGLYDQECSLKLLKIFARRTFANSFSVGASSAIAIVLLLYIASTMFLIIAPF